MCRGRQVRDGGAYGCAVPRTYANLNPGLRQAMLVKQSNSFSRKHRILSLQICVCQTVRLTRKPGQLQNLTTGAGLCVLCRRHIHVHDTSNLMQCITDTWQPYHKTSKQLVNRESDLCTCIKAKGHHFEHLQN